MEKALVIDDISRITQLIKNIFCDAEVLATSTDTVVIPEHDHGWYRKFEKKSKRRNFSKHN